jgi:hypothetical protein
MITIKGALNDISQKFASFLSCLSNQKGILERDIQQLEIEINQLEIDLEEVRVTYKDDGWKEYIKKKFVEGILPFIETQKNISSKAIEYHMTVLWEDLLEIAQDSFKSLESFRLDRNGCVYVNISMIRKIDEFVVRASVIVLEDYSLIIEKINIQNLINKVNDDLSNYHKSVLLNAKKRLGKDFRWNLQQNKNLIILQRQLQANLGKTLKKLKDDINNLSDHTPSCLRKISGYSYKETQVGKVILWILYLRDTRKFFWDIYPGNFLDVNRDINEYNNLPDFGFHGGYNVEVDTTNTVTPANNIEIAYACKGTWTGLIKYIDITGYADSPRSKSISYKSHSYYVTKETIYKHINLTPEIMKWAFLYFDSNSFSGFVEQYLLTDVEVIFQQEKMFLEEYENNLRRSLDKNKKTLKQYLPLEREYVQFLGKISDLEQDLQYQQEYFKQH